MDIPKYVRIVNYVLSHLRDKNNDYIKDTIASAAIVEHIDCWAKGLGLDSRTEQKFVWPIHISFGSVCLCLCIVCKDTGFLPRQKQTFINNVY